MWYSSLWSNSTLAAFRRAITTLLATATAISNAPPQQRRSLHPSADALIASDVLFLLRKWQVKKVSIGAARQGWQKASDHSWSWLGNFKRKTDRIAMIELEMTGEVRALGAGDTGSITMFAVPADKFGERAFDERMLQVCVHL